VKPMMTIGMINPLDIPTAGPDKNIWLHVGTLIDGISLNPVKDAHIVYNAKSILYAGQNRPVRALLNGQKNPALTLPAHTLLPGLTDAHAHLFLEGGELGFKERREYLQKSSNELSDLARKRLEKLIKNGIIAVRDAGDKNGVGLALSRLYKSNDKPLMPYIDSPGAAVHHKGEYGAFMSDPIENYGSLQDVVKFRLKHGADRIKLIATGIIDFKTGKVTKKPQLSRVEIAEIGRVCMECGLQTFAHATGDDGIENVIESFVDSIEHGFFIRDDQLSRMRDKNIAWVPTFTPVQLQIEYKDIMGWDDLVISNLQRILEGHSLSLLKAFDKGVKIIAGSDAGSFGVAHGNGLLLEMEIMEHAGLSPLAVINAASGVGARRLGYKDKFGIIKAGYKSRFMLTENDPLLTVSNLRKEKYIIFDDQVFHAETMDSKGM
jgi:imidazolonepropionase-like amidohydrolase